MAEFEHEIRERVTRIESKLDQILDMIPLVNEHTERITRLEESLKSAHKRIDSLRAEIYRNVSIAMGAITFIFWLLERAGK